MLYDRALYACGKIIMRCVKLSSHAFDGLEISFRILECEVGSRVPTLLTDTLCFHAAYIIYVVTVYCVHVLQNYITCTEEILN